jgi:hypothetical protein
LNDDILQDAFAPNRSSVNKLNQIIICHIKRTNMYRISIAAYFGQIQQSAFSPLYSFIQKKNQLFSGFISITNDDRVDRASTNMDVLANGIFSLR